MLIVNLIIQFRLKLDKFLHWGYELTEQGFFNELRNEHIKMNYYWFNRQEILQKAREKYSKEKLPSIKHKTKKL